MIVEYLESEGFDCSPALAEAGIDRQSFQHLDAMLPLDTLALVSHLMAKGSGRPDIFLATGMRCGPAQYGELGRAMLTAETLRESIALTVRYYSLITKTTVLSMKEANGIVEFCWQPTIGLQYDLLISAFDFVLGAFYHRLVLVLGDEMPDFEVHFSTAAPSDEGRYRRMKRGRFYFAQGGLPSMRLRIDADILSTRMPLANPTMFNQAEARVAMYHKLQQQPQRDWKAWAEMMLRETVGHQPSLEELAVISNVSPSTLTRYLAAQDCNFRQLAGDIRHQRACVMLRDHGMRVGDVAEALGYTAVGNFIRAFKAQAGMSPTQFTAQGSSDKRQNLSNQALTPVGPMASAVNS